jgi:hypothetical protein
MQKQGKDRREFVIVLHIVIEIPIVLLFVQDAEEQREFGVGTDYNSNMSE